MDRHVYVAIYRQLSQLRQHGENDRQKYNSKPRSLECESDILQLVIYLVVISCMSNRLLL